jgi:hypothetical protein
MQHRGIELHLVPAQVAQLGHPKPVPEGQQDHGRVPVPPSIGLGGLDQGIDLAQRQVLPGADLGVGTAGRCNCSIYCGWRDEFEPRFCHEKLPPRNVNCS